MRQTYLISLLILALLVGGLARRGANTAAELLPISSAVNWVEGKGRALDSKLIGNGIRPAHVVRIGKELVPRTPPVMMVYYGACVRMFRDMIGRPLDSADLRKLLWLVNFVGVLPWALLLFSGIVRLATLWGAKGGTGPFLAGWVGWAAMAGTLAFGWLGVVSVYLPLAALGVWCVAMVLESRSRVSFTLAAIAGLCAGISGAWHPSGWMWVIWGLNVLFVAPPDGIAPGKQTAMIVWFGIAAGIGIIISLAGNAVFFGTPAPVQWIDLQPILLDTGDLGRLLWHDLVGYNGLIWLAPLLLPGILSLLVKNGDDHSRLVINFLLILMAAVLFIWGITDDARLISEIESIRPEFKLAPVELADGVFTMVQLGPTSGTPAESRGYMEKLYSRTDIFLGFGGRPVGMPLFLPIGVILGLAGWIRMAGSRFWSGWMWAGVRWGGLLALVMSQAPYGSISEVFMYTGSVIADGRMPIVEALLAVTTRLAEYWPSGVVGFLK